MNRLRETDRCLATIAFGDDYGDNPCTFRCQLSKGHDGRHQEQGQIERKGLTQPYILTWENIPVDQQPVGEQEPVYA